MKMKTREIMAVALLAATVASAATWKEWTTPGTGDWFVAENWDAGVPTAADNHWVKNDGTANISSAGAVCFELNLGYDLHGGGSINVSGDGTLDIGSFTYVARDGDTNDVSTLNITDGGTVFSSNGVYMNYYGPAEARINIDGSNSSWTVVNTFECGRQGLTTLNIRNGGTLNHTVGPFFLPRLEGSSTLNIESGGTFTHSGSDVVVGSSGTGTLNVDGSGSLFLCSSNNLIVGNNGHGAITVTDGGVATAALVSRIGFRAGSIGEFTVSGTGSVFNANTLQMGWNDGGFGTLNIDDAGLVVCESLLTSSTNGTDYGVVRMGGGGRLAIQGDGSADIPAFLGLVDGSDKIEFWTGAAWMNLSNATAGVDVDLVYHATGELAGYTELAVPDNGLSLGDLSIAIEGPTAIISWEGTFGTNYTLQSDTDLAVPPSWPGEQIIPGISGTMSVTTTTSAAQSFYRVIIE